MLVGSVGSGGGLVGVGKKSGGGKGGCCNGGG